MPKHPFLLFGVCMYQSKAFDEAQSRYDAMEPDWPDDDEEEEEEIDGGDLIDPFLEDDRAEAKAQAELERYLNWLYK